MNWLIIATIIVLAIFTVIAIAITIGVIEFVEEQIRGGKKEKKGKKNAGTKKS